MLLIVLCFYVGAPLPPDEASLNILLIAQMVSSTTLDRELSLLNIRQDKRHLAEPVNKMLLISRQGLMHPSMVPDPW